VPRRVNQIINRLLLMGAVEKRDHIDAALLQAVLNDLTGDGGYGSAKPAVTPVPVAEAPVVEMPAAPVPQTFAAVPASAPIIDDSAWRVALAERDEQIAELQQAIIELADMRGAPVEPVVPDFAQQAQVLAQLDEANRRIAALEARPLGGEPGIDEEVVAALEEAHRRIVALESRAGDEQILAAFDEVQRRIASLETRTAEQELAIRHTLTMLIEWIEAEDFHRAAA